MVSLSATWHRDVGLPRGWSLVRFNITLEGITVTFPAIGPLGTACQLQRLVVARRHKCLNVRRLR